MHIAMYAPLKRDLLKEKTRAGHFEQWPGPDFWLPST
jgi:hypothetical protein